MRNLFSIVPCFLICMTALQADTIIFRNGQEVDGQIIAQSRITVTVRTTTGVQTYQKAYIAQIYYGTAHRQQKEALEIKRKQEQVLEKENQQQEQTPKEEPPVVRKHEFAFELAAGPAREKDYLIGFEESINAISVTFGDMFTQTEYTNYRDNAIVSAGMEYKYDRFQTELTISRSVAGYRSDSIAVGPPRTFEQPDGTSVGTGAAGELGFVEIPAARMQTVSFSIGYSVYRNGPFALQPYAGYLQFLSSAKIQFKNGRSYEAVSSRELMLNDLQMNTRTAGVSAGLAFFYNWVYYRPIRLKLNLYGATLKGAASQKGFRTGIPETGGSPFVSLDGYDADVNVQWRGMSLGTFVGVGNGFEIFCRLMAYGARFKPVTFEPVGFSISDAGTYLIEKEIFNALGQNAVSGDQRHASVQLGLRYHFTI